MADKHGASTNDDCKSRIMLTLASGIFAATAHVVEMTIFGTKLPILEVRVSVAIEGTADSNYSL